MFKVGDIIICKRYITDNHPGMITLGKKYKIINVDAYSGNIYVVGNQGFGWWIFKESCILANKETMTEIDYLDNIQQNFKEGV